MRWSLFGLCGLSKSYLKYLAMSTAMRSAADMEEVGCPDPAAVLLRILSTRNCVASSVHCWTCGSVCVVVNCSPLTKVTDHVFLSLRYKFILTLPALKRRGFFLHPTRLPIFFAERRVEALCPEALREACASPVADCPPVRYALAKMFKVAL
jgi:hypothetical protein